jgi:hypothetical protein
MTLDKLLAEFYKKNRIPSDGGVNKNTFGIKVFGIILTLPNPEFRKDVTHVHDIHHILNKCNTTWKGEAFIAGWEISTGFWKHFPICIFSLWVMGYSIWLHPKTVLKGFKKGLNNIGVIDLKISKSELMKLEYDQLIKITTKEKNIEIGIVEWIQFLFWLLISQIIFLFPLILIIASTVYLKK